MSEKEKQASLSDILDAVKELTKAVGDLAAQFKSLEKEWDKWRRAGKF